MISYQFGQNKFNFRSVAILIIKNHVLLQREADDDFWSLPGGRVELFESSGETVVREIEEELGLMTKAGPLQFYVENFFTFKSIHYHEISTYFLMDIENPPEFRPEFDFKGREDDVDMLYRWAPLSRLNTYNIKPAFLIERLNNLPQHTEYVVVKEPLQN